MRLRRFLGRVRRRAVRQREGLDFSRSLARELASLLEVELAGVERPVVAVLGVRNRALTSALQRVGADWSVVDAPGDPFSQPVGLLCAGPLDAIIDRPGPNGRRWRFRHAFFHLRPGGVYVVPGGAVELGPEPGPLGVALREAAASPAAGLRDGARRRSSERERLALRMHVTTRTAGRHLVAQHDLDGVLLKLDEPQCTAWIEQSGGPHRTVKVIPAVTPPDAHVIREVPQPREPASDRPIREATISLRDYRDVIVDVRGVVRTDRVVLPDTFRQNQRPRLSSLGVIDVAPRFAIPVGAPLPAGEELPRLEGTHLHLDDEFRGHFGHLMTETLSRVWSWTEALAIDPQTRVLLTCHPVRPVIPEAEYAFYEACGIPRDRIVTVDGPVRVERLLSGTQMFGNPDYIHPAIAATWDEVGDGLAAQAPEDERAKRIFIARRSPQRPCRNADEVESLFVEHGFAITFPEDFSLAEQVAIFRAADVVAGFAGSGMFQIAFVPDPLRIIQIGSDTYVHRNEVLMAAVRGHHIDAVVSRADRKSVHAEWAVDMDREGPHLRGLLAALPPC